MRASEREASAWRPHGARKRSRTNDFVREDRFSTLGLPVEWQFSSWRDQIAVFVESSTFEHEDAQQGFQADARGYDLGKIAVSSISVDACKYRRDADHIRRSGADHWVLSYRSTGTVASQSGGRAISVGPPNLWLNSLAYPYEAHSRGGSLVSLYIERDHLLPFAERLDRLNHTVLEGITARIGIEFLTSMIRLLPTTTVADIPIFVETAIIVMKGFAEQADPIDRNPTRPVLATRLEMVKRYIDEHLSSSKLEPDDICVAMKLSRRQLYYLFDKLGGVSSYIRNRRLMAFHEAIADPAEDRSIHALAASYGFHDAALFSRQFKAQFGYSPKDAREAKLSGYEPLNARRVQSRNGSVRCARKIECGKLSIRIVSIKQDLTLYTLNH